MAYRHLTIKGFYSLYLALGFRVKSTPTFMQRKLLDLDMIDNLWYNPARQE